MKVNIQDAKILWFFFQPYKFQCLGVLGLMFLSGILETMNLASLYPIINYGLKLEKKDAFLQGFEKVAGLLVPGNYFMAACILLMVISVCAIAAKFCYTFLSNRLLTRIIGDTQKKIFDKFAAADYGFYVGSQQGNLIYAGTTAPERTTAVVLYTITFVYNFFNSLMLFSLLLLLSWQSTVFILLLGLFYGVVIRQVMQKYIRKCSAISVQENQRKNVVLNEFISGIKTIKIFLAVEEWKNRYTNAVNNSLSNQFRIMVAASFPEVFVKFLFYMLIALAGISFSQQSSADILALLPMLGTFVLVVNRFLPSIYVLGNAVMKVTEYMTDTRIVYGLCVKNFDALPEGIRNLSCFKEQISFEGVWFKYGGMNEYLLKDLSFSIERKKMTAIVGASGSGKTTIINLLMKLYRPEKGMLRIDGVDISELKNAAYLSRIGYVSQETFIFNTSIRENIRFGLADCTDQMIEDAARLSNAHDFISRIEQGYEAIVGDSGVKLSGGQRQRIAIARAMLRNPEIIVLDEATSSLDNISEKKIQKAINNIAKHTTVLVIAHRLSTVQNADKIIILEKGEIMEQGTHEDLLKERNLYFSLHAAQNRVEEGFVQESDI